MYITSYCKLSRIQPYKYTHKINKLKCVNKTRKIVFGKKYDLKYYNIVGRVFQDNYNATSAGNIK